MYILKGIICIDATFIQVRDPMEMHSVIMELHTYKYASQNIVAGFFLFCYERDFMLSFADHNQADIVETFNSTSRYLDDLLNIDTPYFEQMVGQIYPTKLQLDKGKSFDTEAPFSDGIVSSTIYDKRDDFDFEIVNFPFLDGDVPRSHFYGVIHFAAYSFCESMFQCYRLHL